MTDEIAGDVSEINDMSNDSQCFNLPFHYL